MSMSDPAHSQRDGSRSPSMSGTGPARLAAYLAAGVGASMVGTPDAEAAVVAIDLTNVGGFNITGTNGNVANGVQRLITNWLGAGTGRLTIYNNFYSVFGLQGDTGLSFAVASTTVRARPKNFAQNATIDQASSFSASYRLTTFANPNYPTTNPRYVSPDFGASSFMGFRFSVGFGQYKYGYLEVTWTASTNTFRILSGAYESTVNAAIAAGAPPTPIPAPSALALLALGGGAFRRARARAA